MRRLTFCAALAAAALATPSFAQERDSQGDDFVDAPRDIVFGLDISEDEPKTSISLGGWMLGSSNVDSTGPRTNVSWSIKAEYPFGGADNFAKNATVDKLGAMPNLSFSINLIGFDARGPNYEDPRFARLTKDAAVACTSRVTSAFDRGDLTPDSADVPAGKTPQQVAADLRDKQLKACVPNPGRPNEGFIRTNLPGRLSELNRISSPGFWTLGLEGSVGAKKFDFVAPGTLAKGDTTLTAWSVKAGFGYYFSDGFTVLKVATEYNRAPEELDKTTVCKTVVVTPADDCAFALPRAPVLEDSLVFRGEVRRFFPFSSGKGGIGAALTGSVDSLSDEWGVELPIYFSIPGDSPVLPGLSFGYNSKDDKLEVGVFLKTAFKF